MADLPKHDLYTVDEANPNEDGTPGSSDNSNYVARTYAEPSTNRTYNLDMRPSSRIAFLSLDGNRMARRRGYRFATFDEITPSAFRPSNDMYEQERNRHQFINGSEGSRGFRNPQINNMEAHSSYFQSTNDSDITSSWCIYQDEVDRPKRSCPNSPLDDVISLAATRMCEIDPSTTNGVRWLCNCTNCQSNLIPPLCNDMLSSPFRASPPFNRGSTQPQARPTIGTGSHPENISNSGNTRVGGRPPLETGSHYSLMAFEKSTYHGDLFFSRHQQPETGTNLETFDVGEQRAHGQAISQRPGTNQDHIEQLLGLALSNSNNRSLVYNNHQDMTNSPNEGSVPAAEGDAEDVPNSQPQFGTNYKCSPNQTKEPAPKHSDKRRSNKRKFNVVKKEYRVAKERNAKGYFRGFKGPEGRYAHNVGRHWTEMEPGFGSRLVNRPYELHELVAMHWGIYRFQGNNNNATAQEFINSRSPEEQKQFHNKWMPLYEERRIEDVNHILHNHKRTVDRVRGQEYEEEQRLEKERQVAEADAAQDEREQETEDNDAVINYQADDESIC